MPLDFQRDDLLLSNATHCCEQSRDLIAACRKNDAIASAVIKSSMNILSKTLNHSIQREDPPLFRKATWVYRL